MDGHSHTGCTEKCKSDVARKEADGFEAERGRREAGHAAHVGQHWLAVCERSFAATGALEHADRMFRAGWWTLADPRALLATLRGDDDHDHDKLTRAARGRYRRGSMSPRTALRTALVALATLVSLPAGAWPVDDGAELSELPAARWQLAGWLPVNRRVDLRRYTLKRLDPRLLATVPEDRRGDGPPEGKTRAYDLDADGRPDLVTFSQVMYGPSQGQIVYVRDGDELKEAFAVSGDWKDLRADARGVTLRFEANILAEGEARFALTLHYDRRAQRWQPLLRTYHAVQGKVPRAAKSVEVVELPAVALLRTTPEREPKPAKPAADPFDVTRVLEGNVAARLPAGAKGLVLARSGSFRFFVLAPASAPSESALGHGMNRLAAEGEAPPPTWQCGWIEVTTPPPR